MEKITLELYDPFERDLFVLNVRPNNWKRSKIYVVLKKIFGFLFTREAKSWYFNRSGPKTGPPKPRRGFYDAGRKIQSSKQVVCR